MGVRKWQLPTGVHSEKLEGIYGQRHLGLQALFIRVEHQGKRFFYWRHVKLMPEIAWFMRPWVTFRKLGAPCGKTFKE